MHQAVADWPQSTELHDHGAWRPEWTQGRRCLYWYLPVRVTALEAALPAAVAELLARTAWLDRVPPAWWHITLCDVGFVDDRPGAVVDGVREAGFEALRAPDVPPLRLGPLVAFPSAVALAVQPLPELRALQSGLRAATRGVLGPGAELVHRHRFWPHLSLGYVNRAVTAHELSGLLGDPRVSSLTAGVVAEVVADRVVLADVERRGRTYAWTVLAEHPLPSPELDS